MRSIILSFTSCLILAVFSLSSTNVSKRNVDITTPEYIIDQQNNIVGKWISKEDSNWTEMYTRDGKCYDYYNGVLK